MNKKRSAAFILAGILLVGIVVLGVYLFNLSRQPLGQPLALNSQLTATAPSGQEGAAPSTTPVGAADSAGSEVCGQSGVFTLLIIGSDAADLRGRPGSDLTRLARVDFSRKKVSTFALPRDLWMLVAWDSRTHSSPTLPWAKLIMKPTLARSRLKIPIR
jgi:hypothetical protein